MNNFNEEVNAKIFNGSNSKLGFDSTRVGKSVDNFESRFSYGSRHSVIKQLTEATDKNQDGFQKLFNSQLKSIKPSNIKFRSQKPKENQLEFKKLAEAQSKDANKLGYGQIAGFRKSQQSIVNEIVNLDKKLDTDKTGAELENLAGKDEIKFLAEVKKSETKPRNVISNATEKVESEKQEIVNDIKTIVNF